MKPTSFVTRLLCTVCVLSLLMIISCSKEKSNSSTNNTQEQQMGRVSTESDAESETIFNAVFDDMFGVSDDLGMAGTGVFGRTDGTAGRLEGCFTVDVTHPNGTPFPAHVVIDFGTAACTGIDGHERRGKIIIDYSNRLVVPGAIATASFENFYFDTIKVEGTYKVTNTSSAGTPASRSFKTEVINAKLTKPSGNNIQWNSVKTITQVEGLATPFFPLDDVFSIQGSSEGQAQRGNLVVAWESNITEPLIKRTICRRIVKGVIKTVRVNAGGNTGWNAILDFGPGTCDNKAVITINGVPYEITLP